LNLATALLDVATLEGVEAGKETRVLDHKGHQLSGVAANVEELEPILLDERLEGGMSG
jgi:hypothetical protein